MTDLPASQDLSVNHVQLETRKMGVDDPPEILLVADVTHEETMVEWRTQLRFSRQQFVAFVRLVDFMMEAEGLK